MRTISKLQIRIRRRVRRNREVLKLHYGHNRELQFRAANLLTTIWWANSVIFILLAIFICLPHGLLDIRAKSLFSVVLLLVGVLFAGCYKLVLTNQFAVARRVIVGGAFLATGFSTLMTGGFPASVSTPSLLIPIILSYCTYGGRISHISTAATVAFLFSQFGITKLFGISFPDLASLSSPQLNYFLVLATTFAIVIMAMISLDISTRKYIDRSERAAQSKSNFLANMSHELRTPMNGVIGLTDLMLTTKLDENQKEYVEAISISGKSLLTIINDLLDYSKIESGHVEIKQEEFNLRKTMQDLVKLTTDTTKNNNVKLHLIYPKDCPELIVGDSDKLCQILIQLVGNAIKFTHEGHVTIKTSITQSTKSTRLRIDIQDTGIGIAREHRNQIFDRFTQGESSTTKKFGGTGLGLAISQRLVDLMNGDIGVKSKLGSGSTFWFEIDTKVAVQEWKEEPVPLSEPSKTLLITARPDNCVKLLEQLSREHDKIYTAPPRQDTLSFINAPEFLNLWNSTIFIDDVSEPAEADKFLATVHPQAGTQTVKLVRISSLEKTTGNVSAIKATTCGTEQRHYR